jgi:prepilin-type N-terminal cleavage/methylation domain-containing protein
MHEKKHGFTLIEILVVMGVIATIIGLVIPNFMGIRQRARDTVKKTNLGEIKTALRLYYNDYQVYPAADTTSPYILGCGTNGTTRCVSGSGTLCTTYEFAAGGATSCDRTYMKKFPDMNGAAVAGYGWNYYQAASGDDFCAVTVLENPGDADIANTVARCGGTGPCGANCTAANRNYCLCAD